MKQTDFLHSEFLGLLINVLGDDKDKLFDFLFPCFKKLVLDPRFQLISMLEILFEALHDAGFDSKKIENVERQTRGWILGPDNTKFTETYWPQENSSRKKKFPDQVNHFFVEAFDKSVDNLFKDYVRLSVDDLMKEVQEKSIKNFNSWNNPKPPIRILSMKKSEDSTGRAPQVVDTANRTEYRQERNRTGIRLHEAVDYVNVDVEGNETIDEELTRQHDQMQLQFLNTLQKVKIEDKERFDRIFAALKKINKKIPQETINNITSLWYGRYDDYTPDDDANDVVTILNTRNITLKIPNENISNDMSRLIIQTYFVALVLGLNVTTIFTIVNIVSEKYTLKHMISDEMIYHNGLPTKDIQNIINNIIGELKLTDDLLIIRQNWKKLKLPLINNSKLLNKISEADDNYKAVKFNLKMRISDIPKDITMDQYIKQVKDIIKCKDTGDKSTIKKILILNEISSLLSYD